MARWAVGAGLDERVINFIQDNPTWLDGDSGDKKRDYQGLDKSADRRAWKKVSDIMKKVDTIKDIHKRVIAGVVGAGAQQPSSVVLSNVMSLQERTCCLSTTKP